MEARKLKKRKSTVKKKKRGRPTKYKKEYCDLIVEWFDRELTVIKNVEKAMPTGVLEVKEEVANKPPMFGEFARKVLKVSHFTLLEWVENYPEFSKAYKECKVIQREFIIMGSLMGYLNSSFGRFTMKNISEWRDHIEPETKEEKAALVLAYSLNEQ